MSWVAALATTANKIRALANRHQLIAGAAFVLLVSTLGLLIVLQGWRSLAPAFDLLPYIYAGREFISEGTFPRHGDTGSYGSFKPPGNAWFMLPSMLMFDDVRLSEAAGTGLLYLTGLLGVFLLARLVFGNLCAYVSVLAYALSQHGLFWANSLWPNGRPDLFVWIVYLTLQWGYRRDGRFLAGALTLWAVAMFLDLAHTPAFLIIPAVWLYYRPPISVKPLAAGASFAVLVWLPYLQFQASRGFVDLRSQLLLQHIFPDGYRAAWCDPALAMKTLEDAANTAIGETIESAIVQGTMLGPVQQALHLASVGWEKLLYNFEPVAPIPGASLVLLLLVLGSILAVTVTWSSHRDAEFLIPHSWRRYTVPLAIAMMIAGILASSFIVGRIPGVDRLLGTSVLSTLQKMLIIGGGVLLAERWVALAVARFSRSVHLPVQSESRARKARLLAISLAVPWFMLLMVAEPGKPERFWWLWPLQIIFLVAFFTDVLPRLDIPKSVPRFGLVAIVAIVLWNPMLVSRVESWADYGWPGPDAPEVQVVDFIANDLRENGQTSAAIGYQTYIYPFMANYHIINPQYKSGAEFDVFFTFRHGIENTNQCAEGIMANDQYRIVQTEPLPWAGAPSSYFDVTLNDSYYKLGDVGAYEIYKRD